MVEAEAEADLRVLKELLELIPGATLGMWTNGQEEFLLQVERTRFEVRPMPLGVWPVPGEATPKVDLLQKGAIHPALREQILAEAVNVAYIMENNSIRPTTSASQIESSCRLRKRRIRIQIKKNHSASRFNEYIPSNPATGLGIFSRVDIKLFLNRM